MKPGTDLLNAALDAIRDRDPLAILAKCLIETGVTEVTVIEALSQRHGEEIAHEFHKAFRAVAAGQSTVNKWGVACKTK